MACTACQKRREAMLRNAKSIERRSAPAPVAPKNLNSCAGCLSRVTPNGWINVCPLCYAQSDPKPTPHSGTPNCPPNCSRNV